MHLTFWHVFLIMVSGIASIAGAAFIPSEGELGKIIAGGLVHSGDVMIGAAIGILLPMGTRSTSATVSTTAVAVAPPPPAAPGKPGHTP